MRSLSRRDLLKEGTAGAAVLTLAGAWTPARAATPSALALAPRRQAIYGSLVTSLKGAADGSLRHADPKRATEAFSGWYTEQPDSTRNHVDAVLDHLGARGVEKGGLKSLKSLGGAGKARFTDREAVDAAAVAAALALAAQSSAPATEEDARAIA